jgi:hypothetical protein
LCALDIVIALLTWAAVSRGYLDLISAATPAVSAQAGTGLPELTAAIVDFGLGIT